MFDRQDESLLTFRQAAGRLPGRPDGRPFRAATLYRWLRLGVHGVRLEAQRIGGRWYTSLAAVQRFLDALAP